MSNVSTPELNHVVLRQISWPTFEALLADLGDHRARIAYDQGTLEIMSPSPKHERLKKLLARLIETFTEELDIDILSCGSTTLKSVLKEKGVEPDECYSVQNEGVVRDKDEIDLEVDPPPDLAVEVEVTKSSLDRRGICAALRIPELWVHDQKKLQVLRLGKENFLDCVKSRQPTICPAETGHRSITPGHLGLLSEALGGRAIRWDPKEEKVVGDAEAEKLLKKVDCRRPWTLSGPA